MVLKNDITKKTIMDLAGLHSKPTILLLIFEVGVNSCDHCKKKNYIPNFDINFLIIYYYYSGNMFHWTTIAPSNI